MSYKLYKIIFNFLETKVVPISKMIRKFTFATRLNINNKTLVEVVWGGLVLPAIVLSGFIFVWVSFRQIV